VTPQAKNDGSRHFPPKPQQCFSLYKRHQRINIKSSNDSNTYGPNTTYGDPRCIFNRPRSSRTRRLCRDQNSQAPRQNFLREQKKKKKKKKKKTKKTPPAFHAACAPKQIRRKNREVSKFGTLNLRK